MEKNLRKNIWNESLCCTHGTNTTLQINYVCVCAQSCLTLCDPMDYSLPGSSLYGIFQARILEWVFPTQVLNSDLPHCRWILYHLSHQGSPK